MQYIKFYPSFYIGIAGYCQVVGFVDAKRLIEDIPNKIVNALCIVAYVHTKS